MKLKLGQLLRLTTCVCSIFAASASLPTVSSAAGLTLPLAQARPAQPAAAPAYPTAPAKGYILEGIVVVVLMAAAVFAVCRTSGRS